MKKTKSFLPIATVVAFILFTCNFTFAQYTLQDQDVTLDNRNYITACSYSFTTTDIIIPDTLQGVTIKGIGIAAFQGKGITSVVFPYGLERIEGTAFRTNALTSINLPAGLTYLGRHSFRDNQLTNVVIPDSVEFIGNETFKNNNITSATLSNSLVYLGYQAFVDNALTSISLPVSLNYIGVQAFINNSITSFVLPNNARPGFQYWLNSNGDTLSPSTTVNDLSLSYTASIPYTLNDNDVNIVNGYITYCRFGIGTVLTIPAQLQGQAVIGVADREEQEAGVFSFMGILDLNLPIGFKYLGEYAFCDNSFYFSDITFPNTLEHIGYFAFYWSNIQSVVIPDAVNYIGELAFGWNPKLETLHLGNALEYIGDYAFVRGNIANLTIPNSVTHIGKYAFERNDIDTLTLGISVKYIGDAAFNINNIANLNIPNSVVHIGKQAFRQNNLTSITLPAATQIGHTFIQWEDENSTTYPANATVSDFNIEYHANFSVDNGSVVFNISDSFGKLPHAEVEVYFVSYFTGYDGMAIIAGLQNGTHPYQVSKQGYYQKTGVAVINNNHNIIHVLLSEFTCQNVDIYVKDPANNPIENARLFLYLTSDTLITDANGHVSTQLVSDTINAYDLSAPGYISVSGVFNIYHNDTTINITLKPDTTNIPVIAVEPTTKLHPNPATDILQISFGDRAHMAKTIEVISLSGQLIERFNTSEQTFSIDMTPLNKGLYFIRISDDNTKPEIFKIIHN
jgi:hypothetical protein